MTDFRMAYAILAHKNPSQVNRLVERLDYDGVEFFVHVDKRNDRIRREIAPAPNLTVLDNNIEVIWGDFSQIEAVLLLLRAANESGRYNYIHLISGQDYPIKSNRVIFESFKARQGVSLLRYKNVNELSHQCLDRIKVYYPRALMGRSGIRKSIYALYAQLVMSFKPLQRDTSILGRNVFKGSNWFSITGGLNEAIIRYVEENVGYVKFFKNVFRGDELFLANIVLNPTFAGFEIRKATVRYVDWKTGPEKPRTLKEEDFPKLESLKRKLFARKFDPDVDSVILDKIDRFLLN